jgi:hypothetical protein
MDSNYFTILNGVDCSGQVEKKGAFSYLSWPYALAELKKRHPRALIHVHEFDGQPFLQMETGAMVKITVSILDGETSIAHTEWFPILDNRNRPIPIPNPFDINTAIKRGMVKAIAGHGLGLYIYAGEDVPTDPDFAPEYWALIQSGKPGAEFEFLVLQQRMTDEQKIDVYNNQPADLTKTAAKKMAREFEGRAWDLVEETRTSIEQCREDSDEAGLAEIKQDLNPEIWPAICAGLSNESVDWLKQLAKQEK